MKKSLLKIAVAAPFLAAAFAAHASEATDSLKVVLKELYPSTSFSEVNETPVQGLYELVAGKNIFYTDASGKYFFMGSLYDMKNSQDLTQERRAALNRIPFDQLALEDSFKEVKGDGSRVMAVFTDPDCPYCRQLESTLAGIDNVTIYRFLYPLVSIHPGADKVSAQIWCAGDDSAKLVAMNAYMNNGVKPDNQGECASPVTRNVDVGEKLGITGTPTLIAADGRLQAGAASRASMEAWLTGPSAKGSAVNVTN